MVKIGLIYILSLGEWFNWEKLLKKIHDLFQNMSEESDQIGKLDDEIWFDNEQNSDSYVVDPNWLDFWSINIVFMSFLVI